MIADLTQRVMRMDIDNDPNLDADLWAFFGLTGPHLPLTSSIDAARHLLEKMYVTSIVTLNFNPSGEGCDIVWFPYGLSGEKEVKASAVHYTLPAAMMLAALRMWTFKEMSKKLP